MTPKIFLTGVTGYVGGEAFSQLYSNHPEYEYRLLVRNEEKAKLVSAKYPSTERLQLVVGSLEDEDIIEKEAAAADIVVHTADSADNEPSARALTRGLASGHTAEKPGYWIHVSGTMLIAGLDKAEEDWLRRDTFHDIDDVALLTDQLPDHCPHRPIDKLVLAANDKPSVRTLVVCPPTIYGRGRGPVNQRSMQVYNLTRFTLQNGFAPVIPPGTARWDNVHVADLGAFLGLAVGAALDPGKRSDPAVFGRHAYFFLEHAAHVWSDVARAVAAEAERQGRLGDGTRPHVRERSAEELGNPSWALHEHGVAARARKFLGWKPVGPSLEETIPEIVESEAARL
ncbi:hypothetical protein JX265_006054 [Neoarthrinium moseri]|uniref:NAD(P)-binding domain-containing protein n=1 Tax=Neoarthrinium moseri TaxID=1658444 RepID=A0A9P9WMK0_9PEZI|nr:hypothetical protein JX265_006054 [Neoarthrinium moseri]